MDQFTKKRLYREYGDDPLMDMYMYVFEQSNRKPWVTDYEGQEKEKHKAIVYETLKLVTEWTNLPDLSEKKT